VNGEWSIVNGEYLLTTHYSPIAKRYACILNLSNLTLYYHAKHTKTFLVFPGAHFNEWCIFFQGCRAC